MSISLEEARHKLDVLEKLASDPKLILTDLFSEGVSGSNFLYQVKVNDKYILDYLKEHILNLSVFKDCIVENNSYDFFVYFPSLKIGKHSNLTGEDKIAKIDAESKEFKITTECINDYESVMNREYTYERKELSEFWQRFKDLSFKSRIKNAFKSLVSNKKIHIRISDFIFWFTITNKKVNVVLDREQQKVDNSNTYNKKRYKEDIERQNYYRKYAPTHIECIKKKQKEIYEYLISLGYTENKDMSIY